MEKNNNNKSSIKKISEIVNLLGRILGLVIKEQEGIRLYKEGVGGGFVDKFPIVFSESFLKYERDNLILT